MLRLSYFLIIVLLISLPSFLIKKVVQNLQSLDLITYISLIRRYEFLCHSNLTVLLV